MSARVSSAGWRTGMVKQRQGNIHCRMLQQMLCPPPRITLLHACSVSSQQLVDIDDVIAPSRRKLLAMLSGAAALVPGSQLLLAGQCRAAADEELSAGVTLAQPSSIEALPPAEQQIPVANSSTAPSTPAAANTGTFSEKTTTVRCAVLHAAGVGDQLHCTALHPWEHVRAADTDAEAACPASICTVVAAVVGTQAEAPSSLFCVQHRQ